MIGSDGRARIGPKRLGELEAVHAGHLDVGDDDVEARRVSLARARASWAALDRGDLVAGGLEDGRQHVAEERRVVDEEEAAGQRVLAHLLALEPILEGERQIVADIDDLGRLRP